MISTIALLSAALAVAAAPTVPAGWKVIKDDKGACQVAVPGDWKVGSTGGMAQTPDGTLSVTVVLEPDATMEPLNETDIRMRRIVKLHENTRQRIWSEGRLMRFGPTASRPWNVWVPAKGKGACHAGLGLKEGAQEDMAKQVVATLGQAQ